MGLLIVLLIGAAAGAYLAFFSLSNTQQVSLNMLGGFVLRDAAMWQIVVVCLAIGLGAAVLLLLPSLLKTACAARAYKSELGRTQAMLEEERRRRPAAINTPTRPAVTVVEPVAVETATEATDKAD
jgi:hypothetical protein